MKTVLASIAIRDVVLIDRLDLGFAEGLCVLTGETGAGKSILLDSLGLALGNRAEGRLLRKGADQASVSAEFHLPRDHPAFAVMEELGLATQEARAEGRLILRRVLREEGRGRAFVNDEPVSAATLRALGDELIEIQGQFEQRGLLDHANHRQLLDSFAGLEPQVERAGSLWHAWKAAETAYSEAEEAFLQAQREEAFLRHAVDELAALAPQPGEDADLEARRVLLKDKTRLVSAADAALRALEGDGDDNSTLNGLALARRALDGIPASSQGALEATSAALDRAEAEIGEATVALQALLDAMAQEGESLEVVEARYFALHDLARKHRCTPEALPDLLRTFEQRLASLESGGARLDALQGEKTAAWQAYAKAATRLTTARRKAASGFDKAVMGELPALKLEQATFRTVLENLEQSQWGPRGADRVAFTVITNPGAAPGPLARIASGGELSRFLLAIKVAQAGQDNALSLVFDEVDSGIGGATADAVGERLARLATDRQVLVVTHSPQVAARGRHHWLVSKLSDGEISRTTVRPLSAEARREEIARMLSGAEVTEEARAAADRLMGAA